MGTKLSKEYFANAQKAALKHEGCSTNLIFSKYNCSVNDKGDLVVGEYVIESEYFKECKGEPTEIIDWIMHTLTMGMSYLIEEVCIHKEPSHLPEGKTEEDLTPDELKVWKELCDCEVCADDVYDVELRYKDFTTFVLFFLYAYCVNNNVKQCCFCERLKSIIENEIKDTYAEVNRDSSKTGEWI